MAHIIARLWAIVNIKATSYADYIFMEGGGMMIVFDRLWSTMRERGISQYKLIKDYHVSTGQLDRLRKNGSVSTYTLNQLCEILDCKLEDIAEFRRQ